MVCSTPADPHSGQSPCVAFFSKTIKYYKKIILDVIISCFASENSQYLNIQ